MSEDNKRRVVQRRNKKQGVTLKTECKETETDSLRYFNKDVDVSDAVDTV